MSPSKKRHPLAVLFGARVAQLRHAKGWMQTDLGKRCGIGQKRVSDVERGVTTAQLDTVARLAKGLGVEPYELLLPGGTKPLDQAEVDPRKIEGFLKRCGPQDRKFLWAVMEDFAGYRAEKD